MTRSVMPEAYRIRRLHWQLFATLTLRKPLCRRCSLPLVFSWLRALSKMHQMQFGRLLWILRLEYGAKAGLPHYHLCIAGIPWASLDDRLCRPLESGWRTCGGGLSQVRLYDPARDGVGYILKVPYIPQDLLLCGESTSGIGGTDCEPMLSDSLIQAVKRGRM